MANELFLDIRFLANEGDLKSIESKLSDLEQKAGKATTGGRGRAKVISDIKKQERAQKELNDKFVRLINLNEVRFRQDKISQANAEKNAESLKRAAINMDILSDNTKRGVQLQKTMQLSQQRISTGFTGMAATSARANQSLMNLGRIVQDLPFGFLGISNNIDPALNSFRALREESGSTFGAFKGLLGALKGSGGLVFALGSLLPTAFLVAERGMNFYKKKVKESEDATESFRSKSELLADSVKSGIGSFIGEFDQNRVETLKEALRQFDPEVNGAKELKFDVDETLNALKDYNSSFGDNGIRIVQNESGEIIRQTREELENAIAESQEINDLVEKELKNRLAVAQAEEKIFEARARLSLLNIADDLPDIEAIDINAPDVVDPDAEARQEAFLNSVSNRAERQNEINRISLETRLAASSKYEQKRIKLIQERINNQQALENTGVEREKAREMASQLFFVKMANLEEQRHNELEDAKTKKTEREEERRKQLRQQALQQSFQIANGFISSLMELNQSQSDESERQARRRFETQKRLSKAQAVVNGAAAIVKTYQEYGFTPFGIGAAAAQAAATAIQIAAIQRTTFNSSGFDGDTSSKQSGFFETDAPNRTRPSTDRPIRPQNNQPINISLEGEFDDEMVSVKAERGKEKRLRGAIFTL